jgi:hypothetical protein
LTPSIGIGLVRIQPTFPRRSGPFDFAIFADHAACVNGSFRHSVSRGGRQLREALQLNEMLE